MDHAYSTTEQADLLIALWKKLGITASVLVGHDIGAVVVEEVISRIGTDTTVPAVRSLVILNSSPYLKSYKPLSAD